MKFIECSGCSAEFRVVSDSHEVIEFCPYCGDTIEHETEVEDYYEERVEE